ncbi:hypothetical protein SO802_022297 [Lithocarpus litseifolius]|uniref:Uncharacterized protein n=1 Tax=Lithocarpus litseifolius TaxID=425828 RepID=A0AAW2CHI8_9ROSI
MTLTAQDCVKNGAPSRPYFLATSRAHGRTQSYTINFGGYLELFSFSIYSDKLCETITLKRSRVAIKFSKFSTPSEPSEIISMLTELAPCKACMEFLMVLVVTKVTLAPFVAKRLENWSIGFM